MISAALTVFAASTHLIYDRMHEHLEGDPSIWNMELVKELLDFLILGITIICVAVPEGLPLAVTIAMAYASKRMYE
jgi:P-type Ca2+ transporter type 2C